MNLAQDERVNWQAVLQALRDHGYGDAHVARRIGATRQRVRKWREIHTQPRHDDGERLLAMWAEVTRQPRDTAPRICIADDFEE